MYYTVSSKKPLKVSTSGVKMLVKKLAAHNRVSEFNAWIFLGAVVTTEVILTAI